MLKKLYLIVGFVFLALVLPAQAQHHGYHGHYHRHHHGHYNWLAPMIVGGAVTYILTRPQPQVVQQQQPIVLQPGQQIVCGRPYQVFNSIQGVYEIKQDCWVQ